MAGVSLAAHRSDRGWSVSRDVDIRETHPKGRSVRTLIRYRMRIPDPAQLYKLGVLAATCDM